MPLSRYRCHKEVQAAKIESVNPTLSILTFEDSSLGNIHLPPDYFQRHAPKAGGYYVKYDDGYESFSPAHAFEKGYTRI